MNFSNQIKARLAALFRKRELDAEMDEELRSHIELRTQANIEAGMNPEEARFAALRQFGWTESIKEDCREQRGVTWLENLAQDILYGARQLRNNPGFTAVAVLTLALGIGANTAIFSVINAVLLRPLPFAEPGRLVWLGGWMGNDKEQGVTPADFLDYREQSQSFALLAASVSDTVAVNLTGGGEPERLHGALVTANYLDAFGVKPALGRTFLAEEDQEGQDGVVVLSHGLWVRRFGSDPAIINSPVTLDGRNCTVIGVMPSQFRYPPGAELWRPFGFPASAQSPFRSRQFHFLRPIARLKPGVTLAQAQGDVETIARRLQELYPETNAKQSLFLTPLRERLVGNIRLTLFIILGAVGCVLLIACTNVANLIFFEQLQQRVAALPGVQAVGLVTELPLANQSADLPFRIEGRPETESGQGPHADIRNINHDYFRVMRIPLLKGRSFTEAEVRENAKVIVISEVLAQRFFAGEDPIGQRLRLEALSQEPCEIIGIVGDVRHRGLGGELRQTVYFPNLSLGYANLVVRTVSDPRNLAAAMRKQVMVIDPHQPVANVRTMEELMAGSVAQPRYRTRLLSGFSAIALLLSAVGIYGVMSYAVSQRTREIGLRMALGARRRNVLSMVVGRGMKLVVIGVAAGIAAALAVTRVMGNLLYGVSDTDPLTFSAVALILMSIALLACLVPACRAARVNPIEALRNE